MRSLRAGQRGARRLNCMTPAGTASQKLRHILRVLRVLFGSLAVAVAAGIVTIGLSFVAGAQENV
jgi:hypothetical protein